MSLKRYYYDKNIEACYTCMFIDEYALNVRGDGEVPHGYDGAALCSVFNDEEKESADNRMFVSPLWIPYPKYKRCTERQADYLDIYDEVQQKIIPNPNGISKVDE